MSRGRRHVAQGLAAVLLAVAVSGCATSRNYRHGEEMARSAMRPTGLGPGEAMPPQQVGPFAVPPLHA